MFETYKSDFHNPMNCEIKFESKLNSKSQNLNITGMRWGNETGLQSMWESSKGGKGMQRRQNRKRM